MIAMVPFLQILTAIALAVFFLPVEVAVTGEPGGGFRAYAVTKLLRAVVTLGLATLTVLAWRWS